MVLDALKFILHRGKFLGMDKKETKQCAHSHAKARRRALPRGVYACLRCDGAAEGGGRRRACRVQRPRDRDGGGRERGDAQGFRVPLHALPQVLIHFSKLHIIFPTRKAPAALSYCRGFF